ncbi:unnamed protein product [Calypogeia fissa]
MPGKPLDKMLRRVQSMTRKAASQENCTSDASIANAKDFKSGSKKFGSGRMIGVFAVLKSSVPNRTKSLSRLDSLPGDIPQGCLAVYVGPEKRRFVISTKYLSHQLFKALLKKCEEEFGFHHEGGLTIATCDPILFQHLIWLIETNNPAAKTTRLEELMDCYPCQ